MVHGTALSMRNEWHISVKSFQQNQKIGHYPPHSSLQCLLFRDSSLPNAFSNNLRKFSSTFHLGNSNFSARGSSFVLAEEPCRNDSLCENICSRNRGEVQRSGHERQFSESTGTVGSSPCSGRSERSRYC